MSEQFERRLREAFHAAPLPAAPDSLRDTLERLPSVAARPRASRRSWSPTRALAALAAVAVIALVAVWLPGHLPGPAAAPTASPPPSRPNATQSPEAQPGGIHWTAVATSGAAGSVLQAGDTVMSALALPGGYLLAGDAKAGQQAVMWFSADGLTWQRIDSDPVFADSLLTTLVAIPGGGVLAVGSAWQLDSQCAGGVFGCNPIQPIRLWISADGRSWQRLSDSATAVFGRVGTLVVASAAGGLVAWGWVFPPKGDPTPMVWTSPDGRAWQAAPQFATTFPHGVVETLVPAPVGLVGVGSNAGSGNSGTIAAVFFSPDGRIWSLAKVPSSGDALPDAYSAKGGVLATGLGADGTSRVFWSSADGSEWTTTAPTSFPFVSTQLSPALLSDGSRVLALGVDSRGASGAWVSGDVTSWQAVPQSGVPPTIPTTSGGATGALGPLGVVLTTTSTKGSGSTSLWFGAWQPSSPPSDTRPCKSGDLRATLDVGAKVGLIQARITVVNVGSAQCTLDGPPALVQLANGQATLPVSYRGDTLTAPGPSASPIAGPVLLEPAGSAYTAFVWQNWCGPTRSSVSVFVTLPDGGGSLRLELGEAYPSCSRTGEESGVNAWTFGLAEPSLPN